MKNYIMISPKGDHPRIKVTKRFVKKNNLKYSNTQDEILRQMQKANDSFLDFSTEVYMDYLDWEHAKPFIKKEYIEKVESGKAKWTYTKDIYKTTQNFLDYMVFAWMKAMDERGISASRSIQKLGAWLYILGRYDLCALIQREDLYNPYGAPALIEVCDNLGIKVPDQLREFARNKC